MGGFHNAYIYPRSREALVGEFKDNQMISAHSALIESVSCSNNVLRLQFGKLKEPKLYGTLSGNNTDNLIDHLSIQDEYESQTVEVHLSTIILPRMSMLHWEISNIQDLVEPSKCSGQLNK